MNKSLTSFLLIAYSSETLAGADPILSIGNESPFMNIVCLIIIGIIIIGGIFGGS